MLRGEIYLADLPSGKGSEQGMSRPVVIVQNNMGNKFSPCCTVVSLTGQANKKWMPTHVTLNKTTCLSSLSTVLAEQITTISKERLGRYIGSVHPSEMMAIDNAVMIQLGLAPSNRNSVQYA